MVQAQTTQQTRTRAVAYIRVSSDKQAEHGVSLEAQHAKLEAYANLFDIVLVDVIVDAGVSAKTLHRPGLQRALSILRKGQANALLVVKLDRLTRSVKDLGTLLEGYFSADSISLLSVGDAIDTRSAAGRLILNVLASVSQWEREAIGERTREAMGHLKAHGRKTGGDLPYGYRLAEDSQTLVEDAPEQELLTAIRNARLRGMTQREVVVELTRQGFTTRKGTAFRLSQVQDIMKRERIA